MFKRLILLNQKNDKGPDIPSRLSGLILITPRYGNSLIECSDFFCWFSNSHRTNFHSTWYPLLLGDLKQYGFKACPRVLHMTSTAVIETQTPWSRVHHFNHLATRSYQYKQALNICIKLHYTMILMGCFPKLKKKENPNNLYLPILPVMVVFPVHLLAPRPRWTSPILGHRRRTAVCGGGSYNAMWYLGSSASATSASCEF